LEANTNGGLKNEMPSGRFADFFVEKLQVDCEAI
jgi:hypothetical protein